MNRTEHGYWFLPLSLVDLGIIGCLITSLVFGSSYMPSSPKGCRKAKTWQVTGNATSLFQSLNGDKAYRCVNGVNRPQVKCTPEDVCNDLMVARILSVVTMSAYG
jgi:hypothetical protein